MKGSHNSFEGVTEALPKTVMVDAPPRLNRRSDSVDRVAVTGASGMEAQRTRQGGEP